MPSWHSLGAYPIYFHRTMIVCAGALVVFTSVGRAGRCSPEVGRVQAEVDGYLEARASAGCSTNTGL